MPHPAAYTRYYQIRYERPSGARRGRSDGLSAENVKTLASACKEAGVRLIPQINLLGHQSWARNTGSLLRAHPEFDETPGKYPQNEGIYCRSYCPLHPQVHDVVFDLIDELADAAGAGPSAGLLMWGSKIMREIPDRATAGNWYLDARPQSQSSPAFSARRIRWHQGHRSRNG